MCIDYSDKQQLTQHPWLHSKSQPSRFAKGLYLNGSIALHHVLGYLHYEKAFTVCTAGPAVKGGGHEQNKVG